MMQYRVSKLIRAHHSYPTKLHLEILNDDHAQARPPYRGGQSKVLSTRSGTHDPGGYCPAGPGTPRQCLLSFPDEGSLSGGRRSGTYAGTTITVQEVGAHCRSLPALAGFVTDSA